MVVSHFVRQTHNSQACICVAPALCLYMHWYCVVYVICDAQSRYRFLFAFSGWRIRCLCLWGLSVESSCALHIVCLLHTEGKIIRPIYLFIWLYLIFSTNKFKHTLYQFDPKFHILYVWKSVILSTEKCIFMGSLKHIHNRQFRFILFMRLPRFLQHRLDTDRQWMRAEKKKRNLNFYRWYNFSFFPSTHSSVFPE